ncbi:Ldh family oxidoreductase [Shinella daejeonensis]|uniref:Ldh family oxidoreductase n=1 Tax=Shinella daejeonensis TaxID=659017 RepID=UPI0020C7F99C|nr:Ldh family oxidoreductase [Shinella daejeonensis]MCP8894792.1 Ldh family oxidoreductase [Shinella daejeonensis]
MSVQTLVAPDVLEARVETALRAAGASGESAAAAVRALMHASRIGVDSHGVRLVVHYDRVLRGGRVNGHPEITVKRTAAATAVVDGDDALGHHAATVAMEKAIELARESGIGAVGVVRSSHFGAAGAYARMAAEAGMIGFATTNSDSVVVPFQGRNAFHGTNPLAFAAPSGGERPWLLDMATSSIPLNRLLLFKSLGRLLPEGVAVDENGVSTVDPAAGRTLLPLGGVDFAFKGAGLAGVATVLSAILQGATLDPDFIPMVGSGDYATPRRMGHFLLAIDPGRFGGHEVFKAGMAAYLRALRENPAQEGADVLAPGDREWRIEAERARTGIPIDPDTAAFLGFRPGSMEPAGRAGETLRT